MATAKKRSLKQIEDEIARLKREAETLRVAEVAEVVRKIQVAIEAYGLTPADLGFRGKTLRKGLGVASKSAGGRSRGRPGVKVPVKYRDELGNTWTGRGNRPKWLTAALEAGKALEDFQVT